MTLSRRAFLGSVVAVPALGPHLDLAAVRQRSSAPFTTDPSRFEPWVEVYPSALRENVRVLSRLAGGRPITAVIKNNGYGLGLVEVARAIEPAPEVAGFDVVKVAEALALRDAGIRKPVLLLALFDDAEGEALVRRDVTLSLCVPDVGARVQRAATRAGRPVQGQLYIDTGMSRMGLPYHEALPIVRELARMPELRITGTLSELTEDREFDTEQVR